MSGDGSMERVSLYDLAGVDGELRQIGSLRGDGFEPIAYSHTKYGSHRAANQFGGALAEAVALRWPDWSRSESPTIVANPYFHTPHAAHLITNATERRLNQLRAAEGLEPVSRAEIRRRSARVDANATSYGRLPESERSRWAEDNPIVFRDGPVEGAAPVRGADVLVIDDLHVTGTSGQQIETFLRNAGQAAHVRFGCVASIDARGADATLEAMLNESDVRNVGDLPRVRGAEGWTVTPWACRLVLTGPDRGRVRRLLGVLSTDEIDQLAEAVRLERYADLPAYQANRDLVERELGRRHPDHEARLAPRTHEI